MGKRTGQIAGLAALGALGYMLSKDKKGGPAPVESRARSSDTPAITSVASKSEEDSYPDESRRGRMTSPPESIAASVNTARVATPAAPRADSSTPGVSDAYPDESRRGRMTSAPETDDVPGAEAAVARFKKETAGMSPAIAQGRYPMTKRQPTTNTYTRAMGAQAGEAEAYRAAQAAKASQPARAAAPAASAASKSASAPASAASRPASAASKAAPEQKSGLTLGTPTRPASGAPSIYAGPEAWAEYRKRQAAGMKRGGAVKKMASGGMTSSASKRGDGIAQRGKTRGKLY